MAVTPRPIAVLFVLTGLLAARSGAAAQTQQERAAAAADALVSVHNENGTVEVRGWDRNEVEVSWRGDPGTAVIAGDPANRRVRTREGVRIEVRVPANARLQVRTMSGSIRVQDVTGSVTLESLSGSFRVTGNPRLVEIEGVSGSIELLGESEAVRLSTVSGTITLPRASGEVEANTTSGGIHVVANDLQRGNFSSTSGTVTFQGTFRNDAALYFDSSSGEIELRLAESVPAEYVLSTITGSLNAAFGPRPTRDSVGQELRFSTGRGARIRATTVSGSVRILRQ